MTRHTLTMQSPVGRLRLRSDGTAVTEVHFLRDDTDRAPAETDEVDPPDPVLVEARRQLTAYFAGELQEFELPLAARGTEFQRRVWRELETIPYGHTASYGEIARRLGMPPGGSRAVGLANGSNPIAIVVPCHRVIGSNGTLTGYAGGVERKRFLLDLESAQAPQASLFR